MLKTLILSLLLLFQKPKIVNININNQNFSLEIAQTITQKAKGLSGRQSLCSTCGMVFIYPKEGYYPFWMKNTNFPLDIIWLNQKGKVVEIVTGQPRNLSILQNSLPAQYIIELNQGAANLQIGDTINLSKLSDLPAGRHGFIDFQTL